MVEKKQNTCVRVFVCVCVCVRERERYSQNINVCNYLCTEETEREWKKLCHVSTKVGFESF